MELYKELLVNILAREEISVTFPNLDVDITHIIELDAYKALNEIKGIIENDTLNDAECFAQIEAIIHTFFKMNIDPGTRHDFG